MSAIAAALGAVLALVGFRTLAVLLVAGATMFTRSVNRLYAIEAGFDPTDVAIVDLVTPTSVMAAPERAAFFARVLERVTAMPGVQAAGFTTRVPLRDGGWQGTVTIEDRSDLRDGREPNALFRIVSPGFFQAMDLAIVTAVGSWPATAPARPRSASSARRSPSGCGPGAIRSAGASSTGSTTSRGGSPSSA